MPLITDGAVQVRAYQCRGHVLSATTICTMRSQALPICSLVQCKASRDCEISQQLHTPPMWLGRGVVANSYVSSSWIMRVAAEAYMHDTKTRPDTEPRTLHCTMQHAFLQDSDTAEQSAGHTAHRRVEGMANLGSLPKVESTWKLALNARYRCAWPAASGRVHRQ